MHVFMFHSEEQQGMKGMSYSLHCKEMSCACANPDAGLGLQVFQHEHQLFPGMH